MSFHPISMPRLSRAHYRRELAAWSLMPVAMGAVEGAVTGVLAKNIFAGIVSETMLNLVVALLASAPAFANILSFVWARATHGKHKIRAATTLQVCTFACVGLIALAPHQPIGLFMILAGGVGARVFWSGVTILRSTVWGANYPRHARAMMAGKLATVQSFLVAAVGTGIGQLTDIDANAFHYTYPILMLVGMGGAWIYSGMRVRGHRVLLAAEQNGNAAETPTANPLLLLRVLRDDKNFRRYMTSMFVFGSGNLMVMAPLIIVLKDRFTFPEQYEVTLQMLMVHTIPLALMPFAIPLWARLLDKRHIVEFRSVHGWVFVAANVLVLLAVLFLQVWMLVLAAIVRGLAYAGGVLGWNLGHHDFATNERSGQYMGVHVTLTGIRGLIMPVIGVSWYTVIEHTWPGKGTWIFLPCLMLSLIGAISFALHARQIRRDRETTS